MKMILASVLAAVVLAAVTGFAFWTSQEPVYRAQPLPSVRIGDPGHNLVGPNWTGNPPVRQEPSTAAGPAVSQVDARRE